MSIFGGGFTAPPNSACKLRQAQGGQPSQQFTSPVRQLGTVPMNPSFGVLPTVPIQQPRLGVQPQQQIVQPPSAPQQNVQGYARPAVPVAPGGPLQQNSPVGPSSYKVMKKGEAPCPVCRG